MKEKNNDIESSYAPKEPSLQKELELEKSDATSGCLRPAGYFGSVDLGVKIVLFFLFSSL